MLQRIQQYPLQFSTHNGGRTHPFVMAAYSLRQQLDQGEGWNWEQLGLSPIPDNACRRTDEIQFAELLQ